MWAATLRVRLRWGVALLRKQTRFCAVKTFCHPCANSFSPAPVATISTLLPQKKHPPPQTPKPKPLAACPAIAPKNSPAACAASPPNIPPTHAVSRANAARLRRTPPTRKSSTNPASAS
ncbi:TPA: hypothetical protein DDW35_03615, partial [Candidatus Sumerlaeota bacterium]|nr:hypothetical protein [Candidatus Sumerlaeota bacterium]